MLVCKSYPFGFIFYFKTHLNFPKYSEINYHGHDRQIFDCLAHTLSLSHTHTNTHTRTHTHTHRERERWIVRERESLYVNLVNGCWDPIHKIAVGVCQVCIEFE